MPDDWQPPAEFDDYVILQELGRGGMGRVYLAEDAVLARHVAIKFISSREPDVAARQRFLIEARAAARVQHPNVVAVYRVGEIHERPYLITEFIRGRTLEDLEKPVPWKRALELGLDLARGLSAAHRRGVLHCDLKPANALVDEDGLAKLLDFGLARLLKRDGSDGDRAQAGAIAGTPAYMAPELWRAEAPTRQSDVFSLGAVIFELVAGRPPFAGVSTGEIAQVAQERGAPPLGEAARDVDGRLAAIVDRCLRKDPAERFTSGEEVRQALEELSRAASGAPVPQGNPYRGLRAFGEAERALFFGRDAEVRVVLERLRTESIVVVAGDSGVGKSSLCRAGVLPAVADGALGGGRTWATATFVPGAKPLAALCAAVAPAVGAAPDALVARVRESPRALAQQLAHALGDGRGLLVFADQLEELVSLSEPAERALAAEALASLAGGLPAVRVVGALRVDFLSRFATLPQLGDDLARVLYLLRPLSRDGLRDVILGPAHATGLQFESTELADALADAAAAADGGLPLLQFALAELWEARDRKRNMITNAALERLGGVAGALSLHADRVIAALPGPQRRAARGMLVRLVTAQGTRARRREPELTEGSPDAEQALRALVQGRLLVAQDADGSSAYELAHEVLIQGWRALRQWLQEDAGGRLVRERLAAATAEWVRVGRSRDALWGAPQLGELAALGSLPLSGDEAEFARRSRMAIRRRRLLRAGAIVAVPAIAAAVYGAVTLSQQRAVDASVRAQLAGAKGSLSTAGAAWRRGNADASAAFARFDAREREQGEQLWSRALAAWAEAERAHAEGSRRLEAALAQDPARADVRALLADELLDRALLEEQLGKADQRDELVARLALYDADGSRLRKWRAPARLSVKTGVPAKIVLERPGADPVDLGWTPLDGREVERGSVVLSLSAPGRAQVRVPLLLARGESLALDVPLPPAAAVPAGFVYVSPGRFLFGSAGDEGSRRGFFDTVPQHEVRTGGFLVRRTEVTFGEWIAFLDDLPAAERAQRTPNVPAKTGSTGALRLEKSAGGWTLRLHPARDAYAAQAGQPIRYARRKEHVEQDWRRFPVVGISAEDAEAYVLWLRRRGLLPRARLCSELEWERAARGADDRTYPHGLVLRQGDVNLDEAHGKDALGPDEVGSHPASRSPFGIDDLSGNAYEWTTSALARGEYVARGGSYFHDQKTAQVVNRTPSIATLRDSTLGMRVCADLEGF